MTFDELESELIQLMSLPMQSQIEIDFAEDKKIFSLSIPIFSSGKREIPLAVQKYVTTVEGMIFRPHSTRYHYNQNLNQIHLVQQLPFDSDARSSIRGQLAAFLELSKTCHAMLCELAAEEKIQLLEQA